MSGNELEVPEETRRLGGERDTVREELARLLADAHDLVMRVKPNLLALYQTTIGAWELRRLKVECDVARLKREIDMAQAALNRGEPPNPEAIRAEIEAEFETWQQRVREAAERLNEAKDRMGNLMPDEEHRELKRLYHGMVKRLHPDLNPDLTPEQREAWHVVQEAYDAGAIERLRALALLRESIAPVTPSTGAEALREEIAKLKQQVTRTIAEIARIQKEPPFTLRASLADEAWVAERREAIEKEIAALELRREDLRKQRNQILPDNGLILEFGAN